MKRNKKERRGTIFCPKCGSKNVFWASGLPQLWSLWECRDCGYRGAFIIEDSKLAEKIRREYTKKESKAKTGKEKGSEKV